MTYINLNTATPEQIAIFEQAQRDINSGMDVQISYQGSDKLHTISYELEEWELHRIGGPAFYVWDLSGNLREIQWWENDKMHRLDGPAWQEWNENGKLILEEYYTNGNQVTSSFVPPPPPDGLGRIFT